MKSFGLAIGAAVLCIGACTKQADNNNSNSNLNGASGTIGTVGGAAGQTAVGSTGGAAPNGSGGAMNASASGHGGSGTTAAAGATAGGSGMGSLAGTTGSSGASGAVATAGAGGNGSAGMTGASGAVAGPPEVMGCDTTKLYQVPDDPGARGPWPVGVKTINVAITGGMIPVEIWYPAQLGSDSGKTKVAYDVGNWVKVIPPYVIPVPDQEKVISECDCYRELPIDSSHGPYPLVVFVHGTASFRVLSASTMTQWASRGFIVAAADHPGLGLQDALADDRNCASTGIGRDERRDVTAVLAGFTGKSGDFAFFGSSVDMTRIGMSGHSAGAQDAANFANMPNVQVDIPMADFGGSPALGSALKSTLLLSGMDDSIVPYSSDQQAYAGSQGAKKRIVGMTGGDHMNVTDFCWTKNSAGQNSLQVAQAHGICDGIGIVGIAALAHCGSMDAKKGTAITNYVSTAALEETLHCQDRQAAFDMLKTKYPEVGDYQHN